MQLDLDDYMLRYNTQRPHQGIHMNGRTPYQAFVEGFPGEEEMIAADPIAAA
jgi:hypothetical protein